MIALCREPGKNTLKSVPKNMAIAYVRSTVAGRSNNKSATAMAAYRSGSIIVDRASGKVHDYTKKLGVDHSAILSPLATTDANKWLTDRAKLWNRVEAGEKRYDAQLAREIVIAIPRELDRDDQIDLIREYVQSSFVDRGMIADINMHHLDGDNPHAHVMLTMRQLQIDGQGIVSFGNKDRTWNDKNLYKRQKLEWGKTANRYLQKAGFAVRIDSRSYEEQGIERIPQVHLGVAVAAMKAKGIPTEHGDKYDRIATANSQILAEINASELIIGDLEQRLAALVTDPTISENTVVTTDFEVAPRKRDREQERKDADLLLVAGEYPDLKKTPEYQAAAQRSKERYQAHLRSNPKPTPPPPKPEPQIKKWEPTRTQDTAPNLTRSIEELADRLGSSFELDSYTISICDDRIDIVYADALALTIDEQQTRLIGDRPKHTIDQHERGLTKAIVLELDRLKIDEAKQLADQQIDREYQAVEQQSIQPEREIEQEQSDNIDFSDDDVSVNFGASSPDWDRDRYPNPHSR
jgi:MobA/MobL family